MAEPRNDLSPADKDPAEGARHAEEGAREAGPDSQQDSHLGAGGDPAEGAD